MYPRRQLWPECILGGVMLAACVSPEHTGVTPAAIDASQLITESASATSSAEMDWVVDVDLTDSQGTVNPLDGLAAGDLEQPLDAIFADRSASPDDPQAYDFSALDAYMEVLIEENPTAPAIWRVDDEADNSRILLSEQPEMWSRVLQRTLTHLNDGWADGHRWGVNYVAYIDERYFETFVEAIHIYNAEARRDVQIVGPGIEVAIQDLPTQTETLAALLDRLEPDDLDYLSFQPQGRTPLEQLAIAQSLRLFLDSHENGRYAQTGLWASQWTSAGPSDGDNPVRLAADDTATRILWQATVDFATLDLPDDGYFAAEGDPTTAFFSSLAFAEMSRETPNRVAVSNDQQHRWPVLAARSQDAGQLSVLIAAPTAVAETYAIRLHGLPPGVRFRAAVYVVDDGTEGWHPRESTTIEAAVDGSLRLNGQLAGPSVVYWKLDAE